MRFYRHGRLGGLLFVLVISGAATSGAAVAEVPDWSEGTRIASPRENPYGFAQAEWMANRRQGYRHALEYPLDISGVLLPWRPLRDLFEDPSPNPIRDILRSAFSGFAKIRNIDDLFAKVGLVAYPKTPAESSDSFPFPEDGPAKSRMGLTIRRVGDIEAFTLSCAACHSANLFGKKILGMTNRFARANEFFDVGKKAIRAVPVSLYEDSFEASTEESDLYGRTRTRLRAVGTKKPSTLGLDTSLAQIGLSLAYRGDDEYASFDRARERSPRENPLHHFVADGKPSVWWNAKYKNRWLSDGSIVSGNPIYTNILWNEIGRGTDLRELETWFERNPKIITELTTAVFSTEAPRITDFFPAERISLERAKRGEAAYVRNCAGCHGVYAKAWNLAGAERLPLADRLRTTRVSYPERTRVLDVGTDPQRARGMAYLEAGLNSLAISRKNGILVKTQTGYVPPPLVGIWARYPYFHNNSAPNLCAVLTAGKDRPRAYYAGEALDRERDYDSDCGGYPEGDRVPAAWKKDSDYRYDTRKPGLGNFGHDEGIFLRNGAEVLTREEKRDLIEFLKTL